MYTDDEIREKRLLARTAGLRGAELLDNIEAIKRDCNGIGAEWMPDRLRDLLGERYPELVIIADIHDRRYALGGGFGRIDASAGTKEDPKTFFYGMDVKNGLYYRYQDVLYIAKADMPACVYYPGSEGVWQWEQVIETSEKLSDVVL